MDLPLAYLVAIGLQNGVASNNCPWHLGLLASEFAKVVKFESLGSVRGHGEKSHNRWNSELV